eukprot:scaffold27049_cov20-Prasinocladus_malaysianus.AAC.2
MIIVSEDSVVPDQSARISRALWCYMDTTTLAIAKCTAAQTLSGLPAPHASCFSILDRPVNSASLRSDSKP